MISGVVVVYCSNCSDGAAWGVACPFDQNSAGSEGLAVVAVPLHPKHGVEPTGGVSPFPVRRKMAVVVVVFVAAGGSGAVEFAA